MVVLSLFDGISCGNYIFEKLGFNIEKYYSSEIDKQAIEVSMKNYPSQIRLGDVRDWKEWDIDFSKIDLIMECRRNFVAKPVRVCDIGNGGQGQRVYSVKDKSVSLTAKGGVAFISYCLPDGFYEFRKLTPIECERLQGLPDNYTDCIKKTHRYKVLDNAWQCNTIEAILKTLKL